MSKPKTSPETVILPVAGVCNFGSERFSTAAAHFFPLRQMLGARAHVPVLQPVIPSGLGLRHSLEDTYTDFKERVGEVTERSPKSRLIFVGHSLGGILARRFVVEQAARGDDRYHGLITVGAPNGPLDHHAYFGPWNRRVDEINDFVDAIGELMPGIEGGSQTGQVAVYRDRVVSHQSALARIPFGIPDRHLLIQRWQRPNPDEIPPDTTVHSTLTLPEHISMITSPEGILVIAGIAKRMVEQYHNEQTQGLPLYSQRGMSPILAEVS